MSEANPEAVESHPLTSQEIEVQKIWSGLMDNIVAKTQETGIKYYTIIGAKADPNDPKSRDTRAIILNETVKSKKRGNEYDTHVIITADGGKSVGWQSIDERISTFISGRIPPQSGDGFIIGYQMKGGRMEDKVIINGEECELRDVPADLFKEAVIKSREAAEKRRQKEIAIPSVDPLILQENVQQVAEIKGLI